MKLYKNKYRVGSIRLQSWNYGWKAAYFITICTHKRKHFFGNININGTVRLSEIGEIVNREWLRTFEMRPDMNLTMGEYIIMPNHFHAVIMIGRNEFNSKPKLEELQDEEFIELEIDPNDIEPYDFESDEVKQSQNQFGPQSKNLASIVRGFKAAVTTQVRKNGDKKFKWQPLFHDHIIRDEKSFHRIQNYIINNPTNWVRDKFYL